MGDADDAKRRRGEDDRDLETAEGEADCQVVNAQRERRDDQAMRLKPARARVLRLDLPRLKNRVKAGQGQDPAGHVARQVVADVAGYRFPQDKADQWHEGFEKAKRDSDADPRPGVDPAQSDPDRTREVAEADGDADEQKADQCGHGRNYMEGASIGISLAILNKNSLPAREIGSRMTPNLQPPLSPKVRPTVA